MMRLWPKSLLGQMLLAVALALLVAQSISAALLFRAAENRREQMVLNAAAFRLVMPSEPEFRERRENRQSRRRGEFRGWDRQNNGLPDRARALRPEQSPTSPALPGERRAADKEQALGEILAEQGFDVAELVVVSRMVADDRYLDGRPRIKRRIVRNYGPRARLLVAGLRQSPDADWTIVRVPEPPRQRGPIRTIVLQTLLIYVLLVGLHFLLLRRITRPLNILTARTENFARTQEPAQPLVAQGPDDIRRLITAHNAMEARIGALLDEKDVMLGAIGHDLKTPLAALRVRIESVEDERERGKMADTIEDISRSLDDILSLARVGRAGDPPERAELGALVASVVEEFEDMGQPVTLEETTRVAHPVHVTWLRRALRNLIGNALRYGGSGEVSLITSDSGIVLRVDDNGPGIPADRIAAMLEPFTRGEASRNRDTGGAGLGLTLARAIAEQHGGQLVLANRAATNGTNGTHGLGGLRAEIRLPPAQPAG